MGKRQHQKDKMYLTCTEWSTFYGGKKAVPPVGDQAEFRRLPFNFCSLSLQPFEHPLCTPEGHMYDLMNIIPYIKKYKTNPITGKPLEVKSLIKLNFHKNNDGEYHCPVLFKVFNNNSHIIAIKNTGNVFCYEAIEELNLKPKHFKDLITDEPFTRADMIILQDPSNLEKFNLAKFHHLQNNLKVESEEEKQAKKDPKYHLKSINKETESILAELDKEYKPKEKAEDKTKQVADKFNAAHYSTGAVAAGFTATTMEPLTKHETAILDEDVVRYSRVKKKGYVRIHTNLGSLNLELHCDLVPKTCENFIKLTKKKYYDGLIFHRSIKNFMIQGGDPTGTGKGGESFWGKAIKDEFRPNLTHSGRGIVSMANSGPNTNKSQFFITYRSCRHLDNKHTVFARVVGGLDTLNAMEKIETDAKDKPKEKIEIQTITVFVDPFQEADEQLAKEREEEIQKQNELEGLSQLEKEKPPSDTLKVHREGVGKFINLSARRDTPSDPTPPKRKKIVNSVQFKNFSNW